MSIELKKKQAELHRISASKLEMEISIADREADIQRLRNELVKQGSAEDKIKQEIIKLEGDKK